MKTILLATAVLVSSASAATIYSVIDTNVGTYGASAGQTFTTPSVFTSGEDTLQSIAIVEATNGVTNAVYSMEVYKYAGQASPASDAATLDTSLATLVATSINTATFDGNTATPFTFNFGPDARLDANSVYLFAFKQGTTSFATFRARMNNSNTYAGGRVFGTGSGQAPTDIAGTITTVIPEPSVALLGGLGALALLRRRRA